jgi:dethiobiotin synthetase
LFVTGTDTGVGKTVLAAALCAAIAARGERVAAFKPALTGLDEDPGQFGHDHELLASITGQEPEAVAPHRYGPPASPHLAAAMTGHELEPAELLAGARAAAEGADVLVVEGVGGLLVPLTPEYSVRDFARQLGLRLLVAARPGLGTINHTLLTIEAAHAAGLGVAAVVLTPWPGQPGPVERSNKTAIERETGLAVEELPYTAPGELAAAGAKLPLKRWLEPTRHTAPG